jgi:hypothetical protein
MLFYPDLLFGLDEVRPKLMLIQWNEKEGRKKGECKEKRGRKNACRLKMLREGEKKRKTERGKEVEREIRRRERSKRKERER